MPRPKSIIPTYRLHKATGQAVAYVNRQEVYLGPHGSPESREAYSSLLDRLRSGETETTVRRAARERQSRRPAVPLNELFMRFILEELPKYATAEQRCIKGAIKIARELYGDTDAAEFGPLRLRTVREAMVRKGWSRSFVNKEIKRLRMVLRWAVGWEMLPRTIVDALGDVKPLAAGDSEAPESIPRKAISAADIQAVKAMLCERHRDLVDLMLMTGCRSGELLSLTTGMIDRTGEIWRTDLERHKTRHQGKSRTLFYNPTAQMILRKYLQADPDVRLFTLRGDTFSKAVKVACVKAGVPVFTPHWLRHTVATKLADEVGIEGAQRLLGHSQAAMTRHYSQAAERQAVAAVNRLG